MLQRELGTSYKLEWDMEKELSPLRIRPKESSQLQSIVSKWVKAICAIANVKPSRDPTDTYIIIYIQSDDRTTYTSVFGNGTIMFQGKKSQQWLQNNIAQVVQTVKSDPKKTSTYPRKISTEQTSCTVCKEEYTNDMVECYNCKKWIHYDCDIDAILDSEAEHKYLRKYMCPKCRDSPSKNIVSSKNKNNMNSTKTRASSRITKLTETISKKVTSESKINETFIINSKDTETTSAVPQTKHTSDKPIENQEDNRDRAPVPPNPIQNSPEENHNGRPEIQNNHIILTDKDDRVNPSTPVAQINTNERKNNDLFSDDETSWFDDDDLQGTNCSLEVTRGPSNSRNTAFTPVKEIEEISSDEESDESSNIQNTPMKEVCEASSKDESDKSSNIRETPFIPVAEVGEVSSDSEDDASVIELKAIEKSDEEINLETGNISSLHLTKILDGNPEYYTLNSIQPNHETISQPDETLEAQHIDSERESLTQINCEESVSQNTNNANIDDQNTVLTAQSEAPKPSPNNMTELRQHHGEEDPPRYSTKTTKVLRLTGKLSNQQAEKEYQKKTNKRSNATKSQLEHKSKTEVIKEYMKLSEAFNDSQDTVKKQENEIIELQQKMVEYESNKRRIDDVLSATAEMKDHPIEALIAEKQQIEIEAHTEISNLCTKLEAVSKSNAKKQNELTRLRNTVKVAEEKISSQQQKIEVDAGHRKRIEELERIKSEKCKNYEDIIQQVQKELHENRGKLKEAENKLDKLPEERELGHQLTESVKEVKRLEESNKKLKEEIAKMVTERINEFEEENEIIINLERKKKAHGLPNVTGNLCFMISPYQLLATVIPDLALSKEEGSTGEIIAEVRDHLKGKKSKPEAEELIWRILLQAAEKFPEYVKNDNSGTVQADATEHLQRILGDLQEENVKIEDELKCITNQVTHCLNPLCGHMSEAPNQIEFVLRTNQLPNNTRLEMQDVIDKYLLDSSTRTEDCFYCGSRQIQETVIDSAPPTLMIHVNRVNEKGRKSNVKVRLGNRNIQLSKKGEPCQNYEIVATLVHHGDHSTNGHYVINYYDEQDQCWYNVNDDRVSKLDKWKADKSNEDTVVAVLRRVNKSTNKKAVSISRSQSKICQWYLRNKCKFGKRCWNDHPERNDRTSIKPASEDYGYNNIAAPANTIQVVNKVLKPCWNFQKYGSCKYRDRCRYHHPSKTDGTEGHKHIAPNQMISRKNRINHQPATYQKTPLNQPYYTVDYSTGQPERNTANYYSNEDGSQMYPDAPIRDQYNKNHYSEFYEVNNYTNSMNVNKTSPTGSQHHPMYPEEPPADEHQINLTNRPDHSSRDQYPTSGEEDNLHEEPSTTEQHPWYWYSQENPGYYWWKQKQASLINSYSYKQATPYESTKEHTVNNRQKSSLNTKESIRRPNRGVGNANRTPRQRVNMSENDSNHQKSKERLNRNHVQTNFTSHGNSKGKSKTQEPRKKTD